MEITNKTIDKGKSFDWGRVSGDYPKYRDIYPALFYQKITQRNLCVAGQKVLDFSVFCILSQKKLCLSFLKY